MAASANSFTATNSTPRSGTVQSSRRAPRLCPFGDVPKKAKKIRVERGLYRAGGTYYACVTPPGERQARWRTLGEIGLMQAPRTVREVAAEWLAEQQHR